MHCQNLVLVALAVYGVGAYTVDLSANQASYSCPADNKKTYTIAPVGKRPTIFELRCGVGTKATPLRNTNAASLKDCADICANDVDCYSSDYDQSSGNCALKRVPGQNIPYGVDTWYPQECPKQRASSANPAPQQATDIACPWSDGQIFNTTDGTWFYSQCCTDTAGASILGLEAAKDHADCAELCAKDANCKSFSFADNGGVYPQNCKLYGAGGFSTTFADGAHFAYVTDPPTDDPVLSDAKLCSTECPYADGQLYTAVTGENYQMFCKKRHGTDYLKIERKATFEACVASCAAMPECDSTDYEPRTQKCFYSNNQHAPAIDAPAFMSAYSLGCAGSCASCKNSTSCNMSKKQPALPLNPDPVTCQNEDGAIVTIDGMDWRVRCYHCFHGNDAGGADGTTLRECASHCANDKDCVGVNLIKDRCIMHRAVDKSGGKVIFAKNANCDTLAPIDRGHNDMQLSYPSNALTTRPW